jgi:hypothetical protein
MDETLGQFERIQGSSHHLKSRAFSVQLSQKNTASRFGFGGHCWQDLVSSYKWQRHYASSYQQRGSHFVRAFSRSSSRVPSGRIRTTKTAGDLGQ